MAPGTLLEHHCATDPSQPPTKKRRLSPAATVNVDHDDVEAATVDSDDVEDVAAAVPTHPLDIKPAGNAYTATENIKSRCGAFARLPDELLNHFLESLDADALVALGATCRALYAFTRLDELWRALFIA